VVTDFGLALCHGGGDLTATGDRRTLRYMIPNRPGRQGPRRSPTDVYSLGVTLYELLTLRHPHPAATAKSPAANPLDDPATPTPRPAGSARRLETVILKALAKVAGERLCHRGELAADLRRSSTTSQS